MTVERTSFLVVHTALYTFLSGSAYCIAFAEMEKPPVHTT